MTKHILILILLALCHRATALRAENGDCLTDQEAQSDLLYAQLQQDAYRALDRRLESYEALETPEDIHQYQQRLRGFFVSQLGGFPQRTALNAKTVRTIPGDGYRIECVIFESQPHHHITANLYLPENDEPVPGVAVSSGHSRTAKTADYNQRFGIMMARQGIAALCFDPIGQGERAQILKDGEPFLGTTGEHFLIGFGSTLVGRSTARYRIWDAMRAIDYLASRPEIDPTRIGFTGCSGGGTLTSYVMALDDRVACAAPACYLTTFRRLIETIGPQDAEQNVYGQIEFGLDQPDYVLLRAPRPTLISSTTDDFFDIQGSWINFRQAKRVYSKLGFPERVDLVEVEGNHGVKPQNLATIAHWMNRWLLGRDKPVAAIELDTREPTQLLCTTTGQVLTSLPDEQSVFDLNASYGFELAERRRDEKARVTQAERRQQIAELMAIGQDREIGATSTENRGDFQHQGDTIEKRLLRFGTNAKLPLWVWEKSSEPTDVYLILDDEGKQGAIDKRNTWAPQVPDNASVVFVDLRGQGETSSGKPDPVLTDWKTFYLAYLLGKPLVGIRVQDVLATSQFLAQHQGDGQRRIHLLASGRTGIVALHAAALQPDAFASVTLSGTPRSWTDLLPKQYPAGQLDTAVHGALEVYDLPDLVQLAGADKITIVP